ncbi:DUF1361 domain-containing protein [Crocosphaera sp. Alani8]|uniref:DUF1361 domain-containing protein n=1 Tax=Crocosphaera sp. Alani8 TaxID=3038952 RepID=UPI00313CDD28
MNLEIYEEVLFNYLSSRLPIIFFFSLATLGMEWMRSRLYEGRFYQPFLLNLILAWVPLVLSVVADIIFWQNGLHENWITLVLLGMWFAFFPNSIYLITEVHHFRDRFADHSREPFWFDNIEILSLVSVGLLIGSHSLVIIHFLLRNHFSNSLSWITVISYVFLANFGIYIGRYWRFNSWDIFRRPFSLFKQIFRELSSCSQAKVLIIYIILFSFFILMFYLFVHLTIINLYTLTNQLEQLRTL